MTPRDLKIMRALGIFTNVLFWLGITGIAFNLVR